MGLGGLARALAKGIDGYTDGLEYKDRKARQAKEDAYRDSERQAVIDERQRNADMRKSLADAMKPAQVDTGYQVTDDAGSNAFTKDADAAAVLQDMAGTANTGAGLAQATRVNQAAFTDPAKAKQAATDYDNPIARTERASTAVMPFDPAKGLSLQNAAVTARTAEEAQEVKRQERAKALKREGIENTFRAMRSRDPEAVFASFNQGGDTKLVEPPKIIGSRKVKTPWGEVDDDEWEGTFVGADGKPRTVKLSTFQIGQQLASVSDLLKDEREAGKIGLEQRGRVELEGIKSGNALKLENVRSGNTLREIGVRAASDGGPKPLSSMDRMLIDGRRAEARKTVDSIQDQLNDKLLTVQAQRPGPAQDRYNALQARLKEAQAEYQRWDSAMNELAMSAVGRAGLSSAAPAKAPAPGLSAAKPKPPSAAQVQGLPKGASIGAFDSGKGWQVRDSSGKLLGYVKE